MANREPWTADYVCNEHERPGDHPDEASCAAHKFRPAGTAAPTQGTSSPVMPWGEDPRPPELPAKRYKLRPSPAEVTAVPEGPDMAVSVDAGPSFYVARDMFFAFFELAEPEELPEEAGALAKAPELGQDASKAADPTAEGEGQQ
jgi:hypothetical protein